MTEKHSPDSHRTSSLLEIEVGTPPWIEACWEDMRSRALSGEPFDADRYISMIPNPSPEQTADLVYGEFVLSRDSGKHVTADQFLDKYPAAADQLERQFSVDDALSDISSEPFSVVGDESADPELDADSEETLVGNSEPPEFIPEDPQTSSSHTRIGRYIIVNALKHGAQGEVYRAYDSALKRDVVIKIEAKQETPSSQRLFSDSEAVITANLNHPNIAPALDAGDHQGRKYSVSRYIRGRTFDQWIRAGRPAPEEVARLLAKIARGLASAHEKGTLHLDIKPRNILVDENQEPYLIDFGLSVVADAYQQDQLEEGVIRGTLQYMAPEQIRGEADTIGTCSDIFGLGATLFMGWVGRAPYDVPQTRDDLTPIEKCQWRTEWLETADISDEMKAVVSRAMAASPENRYQSSAELAADLERLAGDRPSTNVHRETKNNPSPLFAWLLGAACVVLLGLAIWSAIPTDSRAPVPATIAVPTLGVSVGVDGERFIDLTSRVPLVSGDKLRLGGVIPANRTAVLCGLAPDGSLQKITSFGKQEADRDFQHPSEPGKAIPLVGQPGTEIIAILTGDSMVAIEETLDHFAKTEQALPLIPESTVLTLHDGRVAQAVAERSVDDAFAQRLGGESRKLGSEVEINPALAAVSEKLESLANHCKQQEIQIHAVAFRHLEAAQADENR